MCTAARRELQESVTRGEAGQSWSLYVGKTNEHRTPLVTVTSASAARIVAACSALSCRVRVICLQILPLGTSPL